MKVNGQVKQPDTFKILRYFWDNVPYLTGYKSSIAALFLAILDSINQNRWRDKTSIPFEYLINKAGIGNKVYFSDRQWLVDNELIIVVAGTNGYQAAIFSLGSAVLNDTGNNTTKDTGNNTGNNISATQVTTHFIKDSKTVKQKTSISKEVNIPFSFFWEKYEKKVGSKSRAENFWNNLTDEERKKAMNHIPKYKQEFPDNTFRKYPEGYLKDKRFNDENTKPVNKHTPKEEQMSFDGRKILTA